VLRPPGRTADLQVPLPEALPDGELLLTVFFHLLEETLWAPKGHVVAWDQMEVRPRSAGGEVEGADDVRLETTSDAVVARAGEVTVRVGRKTGAIESLKVAGAERLARRSSRTSARSPTRTSAPRISGRRISARG